MAPRAIPATDGVQASNIDNNNGTTTQETATELAFTNRAEATGTYSHDATAYTHYGGVRSPPKTSRSRRAPRLSHYFRAKPPRGRSTSRSPSTRRRPRRSVWSTRSLTDSTDAFEPGMDIGHREQRWHLDGGLGRRRVEARMSGDLDPRIRPVTLTHYQENGSNAAPVLAADSWENKISSTAFADGRAVRGQLCRRSGRRYSLDPQGSRGSRRHGGLLRRRFGNCRLGDADERRAHGPGDRVCWRLTVTGNQLYGDDYAVQDYLPDGFAYESWAYGEHNTADVGNITFDGSSTATGYLRWALDDNATNTDPDGVFETVVSTIITGPTGNGSGDLLSNLMKFGGQNTPGEAYQLRDDADAVWGQPVIGIDKQADHTIVQGGDAVASPSRREHRQRCFARRRGLGPAPCGTRMCDGSADIDLSGGVCNGSSNRIEWTIPSIAANGGSVDLAYAVTVPPGVGANETFENNEPGCASTSAREHRAERPIPVHPDRQHRLEPSRYAKHGAGADTHGRSTPKRWGLRRRNNPDRRTGNVPPIRRRSVSVSTTGHRAIPEGVTVYDGVLVDDYDETGLGTWRQCRRNAEWVCRCLQDGRSPPRAPRSPIDYPATEYVNAPDTGDDILILTFSATVLYVAANRRSLSLPNRARQTWDDSRTPPSRPHDRPATTRRFASSSRT